MKCIKKELVPPFFSTKPSSLSRFSGIPDWFILCIRIPGSDNADQHSHFCILLDFHDGSLRGVENGWLVHIQNADPNDGLISERTQVHKARVDVLIYCFHHNIVCAPVLEVERLKDKIKKNNLIQVPKLYKVTLFFCLKLIVRCCIKTTLMNRSRLLY